MTYPDCPYCSGSGIVAHDGVIFGLDDTAFCPLCDGSGICAPRATFTQWVARTFRYAAHTREALVLAAALACAGVVLLTVALLGSA